MPGLPKENPARRIAESARRLNRQPQLLRSVQRTRERLLGGDEFVDRLSTSRDRPSESFRPQLRTGIHLGRPRKVGGDYLGVDVNVAARICDAAKPGEILVSDRALLRLDPQVVHGKHRRFRAKGVPKEVAVYSISATSSE